MATLRVTSLRGRTAGTSPTLPDGAVVGSAVTINSTGIDAGAGIITATSGSFTSNLTVGGTLTYEDVTNIDSVGIITARQGIVVTGVVTATSFVGVPAGFSELDAALFN